MEQQKTVKDLVIVEKINPVEVFTPEGIKPLLAKITSEVKSFALDVNTPSGRKDITSLAYKVAQSKTYLDGVGKDLVAEWKAKVAAVDTIRKQIRDHMDELKDEIRAPLEEWEIKEHARIYSLKHRLKLIDDLSYDGINLSAVELGQRLHKAEEITIDDTWEEFKDHAQVAKNSVIETLKTQLEAQVRYEAQQAEIEKLKAEQAERDRLEQERVKAEEKIKRDELAAKQAAERERLELIRQKEAAEQRAKQAEEAAARAERQAAERAEQEKRAAAEREEQRIKQEKYAIQKAEEERKRQEEIAQTKADQEKKEKENRQKRLAVIEVRLDKFLESGESTHSLAEWIDDNYIARAELKK
jgi:hypothetical protein